MSAPTPEALRAAAERSAELKLNAQTGTRPGDPLPVILPGSTERLSSADRDAVEAALGRPLVPTTPGGAINVAHARAALRRAAVANRWGVPA